MQQRLTETLVGCFILLAIISLVLLALKVSGLTSFFPEKSYTVTASFDDIGGLKVRAPVKIGGVQVGEVAAIKLDPVTFKASVKLAINKQVNEIPDDSTAGILTAGLLGDNYIEIVPLYSQSFLKDGGQIQITHSAMILEKLIGQLIYKLGNSSNTSSSTNTNGSGGSNAKV